MQQGSLDMVGRSRRAGRAGRVVPAVVLIAVLIAIVAAFLFTFRTATKPAGPVQPAPSTPSDAPIPRGTASIEPAPQPAASASPAPQPAMTPQRSKQFDELMNAAITLQSDAKWEKAAALLDQAIPQFADQQAIYVEYARVLTVLQRHEKAYDNYEKAIAIGPVDFDLHLAAGVSATAAGKTSEAIEHFGAAQVINKADARPPLYLGQAQAKLGRIDEAKKNLLLAANLKPDMAVAWGSLADIALRENAANLALQHIEKARQLEPDSTVWRLIHGRALKRLGRAQEALDLVVGLSSEQKMQPGVLQLMGECYGLVQRPKDMARECSTLADTFTTQGDVALEAARWWIRAGDPEQAKPYARRALYLNTPGAKDVANELGVK